ncbi:4220_t:CDS:2 [Funneliformis mosseae]|uniref:4220_t:CDS:1 n=1 Tax=Funneliformis mosseae TaxID=27381 RepID=A0A9N8V9W9_FUNMO|nr:4220_t:CDS:2 [Funneliformis mosseae]
MTENCEDDKSHVMCVCKQSISKLDWQDHQIVCAKRRYMCPAFAAFINCNPDKGLLPPLVDSNCPLSLKEIAKLQKFSRTEWLKSKTIPFKIINTLTRECPIFGSKQELINHIEKSCPYWKVKCLEVPKAHFWNSHDDCSFDMEFSIQEFISHSKESALDPISQRIRVISKIFPYYCKRCDHHFPSSGSHICIKETNFMNTQNQEILCPSCKSIISVNSSKEIENTCDVQNVQKYGSTTF